MYAETGWSRSGGMPGKEGVSSEEPEEGICVWSEPSGDGVELRGVESGSDDRVSDSESEGMSKEPGMEPGVCERRYRDDSVPRGTAPSAWAVLLTVVGLRRLP